MKVDNNVIENYGEVENEVADVLIVLVQICNKNVFLNINVKTSLDNYKYES